MKRLILGCLLIVSFLFGWALTVQSKDNLPESKERCPVCGMFVAKYPLWLAMISSDDGQRFYFDGVKDMMAYLFAPEDFGGKAGQQFTDIQVTDYYSQQWIDGKTALYVVGSDILGPMGHELIPFSSEAAAKNFLKDHHGKEILSFADISDGRIQAMREGHMMKNMKQK